MLDDSDLRTAIGRRILGLSAVLILGLTLSGCKPDDPLEAIRQQHSTGNAAETLEPLRELVVERPDDAEINYLYGRALIFSGQPSLATWPLDLAMNDPEWLLPAGLLLAKTALATNDLNQVVDITTRILEQHPDNATALLFRAQAHAHWKAHPEAALADVARVVELEPENTDVYEPWILALVALDRHPEAVLKLAEMGEKMKASEASESSMAWHCSTTAIFAGEAGETQRADETWRSCLDKYPADATVVMNAVQFYDGKAEWQTSLEAMRRAHEEAPNQPAFRNALANRLRAMGQAAEGEALLREATEVDDPRLAANAWADLAEYRHGMLEHAAAADALARAIETIREVDEPTPQLVFLYADALLISNQLDRAAEIAEDISVPAQRHMILGRIAQERGNAALAMREFDEALRVWPDNPFARYYAALAAERLGEFDRALEEYRYAVRIQVGATDARTRAARQLVAEGRPLLAYQILFLQVAEAPLEPEGELLSMYLMARVANPGQLKTSLIELAARDPRRLPAALVRGAEGASELAGPASAMDLLRDAPNIDYTHPSAAPPLRVFIRMAHSSGARQEARSAVDAALAAHPEAAEFHELDGLDLELGGAAPALTRKAYERAVAIDPSNAGALAGLGRLTLESDPEQAIAYFDRAYAADQDDPSPILSAARALLSIGKTDEAERRLNALLEQHPHEATAAAELVRIDLDRGVATTTTVERARRAGRFGGGADALDLLSRVHAMRDEPELSAKAAEAAKALRAAQSSARPVDG